MNTSITFAKKSDNAGVYQHDRFNETKLLISIFYFIENKAISTGTLFKIGFISATISALCVANSKILFGFPLFLRFPIRN